MSATVLKFVSGDRLVESRQDKALALMDEYYKIFEIEDLEKRQEAYAIWHTKAMIEKLNARK